MKNIIISPIHKSLFFAGNLWNGLDLTKLKYFIEEKDSDCHVKVIRFSEISHDYSLLPIGCLFFYTSSYNYDYQLYIKDVILDLSISRPDVKIVPKIDLLYSFENKGFQELVKRRLNIREVKGGYYGDIEDLNTTQISFPAVCKSLGGSVSSGVSLIRTVKELAVFIQQRTKKPFIERLKHRINSRRRHVTNESCYRDFFKNRYPFVIQQFIPQLICDYKVLVFGKKYYALKRNVRKNDFRASGSGLFEWVTPPEYLVRYAKCIVDKIDVPFISLDIADNDGVCELIEFQGIGFGPVTLTNSSSYFTIDGECIVKHDSLSILEEEYANAIIEYTKKHLF